MAQSNVARETEAADAAADRTVTEHGAILNALPNALSAVQAAVAQPTVTTVSTTTPKLTPTPIVPRPGLPDVHLPLAASSDAVPDADGLNSMACRYTPSLTQVAANTCARLPSTSYGQFLEKHGEAAKTFPVGWPFVGHDFITGENGAEVPLIGPIFFSDHWPGPYLNDKWSAGMKYGDVVYYDGKVFLYEDLKEAARKTSEINGEERFKAWTEKASERYQLYHKLIQFTNQLAAKTKQGGNEGRLAQILLNVIKRRYGVIPQVRLDGDGGSITDDLWGRLADAAKELYEKGINITVTEEFYDVEFSEIVTQYHLDMTSKEVSYLVARSTKGEFLGVLGFVQKRNERIQITVVQRQTKLLRTAH
jgi:hypothetical protein